MPPYSVSDWANAAQNRAGTGGIAIGHLDNLQTVQIPSAASRVDFRADTTIGVLSIAQCTFNKQDPGALSNFLLRVTQHNHHLSAMIVHLGHPNASTVCTGLEDSVPSMKAKTKKSKGGGGARTMRSSSPPGTRAWCLRRQSTVGQRGKGMNPWATTSASTVRGPALWYHHPRRVYRSRSQPNSSATSMPSSLGWAFRGCGSWSEGRIGGGEHGGPSFASGLSLGVARCHFG